MSVFAVQEQGLNLQRGVIQFGRHKWLPHALQQLLKSFASKSIPTHTEPSGLGARAPPTPSFDFNSFKVNVVDDPGSSGQKLKRH
jgi:hypothetical protein